MWNKLGGSETLWLKP